MDAQTLLIAAISLSICALPFVFIGINRKKNKRNLLNRLSELSENKGFQFDQVDAFTNLIIGLDGQKNRVYFLRKYDNEEQFNEIDLSNFTKVEVKSTHKKHTDESESPGIIENVAIRFLSGKGIDPIELKIFEREKSTGLSWELQLATEWTLLLNERLKSRQFQ